MSEHTPRYIQRVFRRPEINFDAKGIDRYFAFDYMGSAEFEFGAMPKALKAMREEKLLVEPKRIKFRDGQTVWYVGPGDMLETARQLFFCQLQDPFTPRLKEMSKIQDKFGLGWRPKAQQFAEDIIGWWDIGSTYAFFCHKQDAKLWLSLI